MSSTTSATLRPMPNDAALYISIAIAFLLPACMKTHPETAASKDKLIRDAFPPSAIVILTDHPDPKSNMLTLQNYHRDGSSYIPIFSSKESFEQSTKGGVDKPTYQIDRRLFVSMLHGSETVIFDVALPNEIVTSGNDLKRIFPEPFDISRPTPSQ
jgi:hypothetical protein